MKKIHSSRGIQIIHSTRAPGLVFYFSQVLSQEDHFCPYTVQTVSPFIKVNTCMALHTWWGDYTDFPQLAWDGATWHTQLLAWKNPRTCQWVPIGSGTGVYVTPHPSVLFKIHTNSTSSTIKLKVPGWRFFWLLYVIVGVALHNGPPHMLGLCEFDGAGQLNRTVVKAEQQRIYSSM